jgi:CDP-2,3-bis-(O-geranylgeranyl)-sn-glycerol synthase
MQPLLIIKLLVLLSLANGAPVLIKKLCGNRFSLPIDGGCKFLDGSPLFGPSKTIRGVLVSVAATTAGAPLLGLGLMIGAVVGSAAMAGDLFSSFVKRRLNLRPSSRATGLDQIPESLIPLLACLGWLPLTLLDILTGVAVFLIGEIVLSRVFYRFGLRDRPY